ncbi:MAG: sugar kinase, partial [Alphaproteobacteria bacterium]
MVEFVHQGGGLYRRGVGGDTSNAAIAAARQGARVGFLTALGADRFGDSIMDLWRAEGVDAAHVRRNADAPTGIYFIDPDPEGRFFTYYRAGSAASLMRPDDLPADAIRATRCLHLSGITLAVSPDLRDTALAAIDLAAQAGVSVSLDTNLRLKLWDAETARRVIDGTLERVRIVVTSIEDSLHLTGLGEPEAIGEFYRRRGPEIV